MYIAKAIVSSISLCVALLGLTFLAACQLNHSPAAVDTRPTIRIDAGSTTPFTDTSGNVRLADTGFDGGDVVDRGADTAITGTKDQALYRTEHWGMTAFTYPVANGKYTIKLHFAETCPDVGAIGERVFSIKVGDKEIKDLDVWAKAGAKQKAYVETVPVEITNGKLEISFTQYVQEPEINGIEIIPK
jgi:hypothetical protein